MALSARPLELSDLPELTTLQLAEDQCWFGAKEHDEEEVRDAVLRAEPLSERSRALRAGDRLVAAAWWWRSDEATIVVDESADVAEIYDDLLPWLSDSGVRRIEALQRDERRKAALGRHGWTYRLSQFELMRDISALPQPTWPTGIAITPLGEHAADCHRVIYDEARWADVPGHSGREFAEWHQLFIAGENPEQQILAWQGDRLVGVSITTIFSDQVGWVGQLAVAGDQQGRGLGSALLAESMRVLVAAGATRLGLGVSAANPDALRLYERVGYTVDREWQAFAPVD